MFETQVLDFIIPNGGKLSKLEPETSDPSILRGGVCERGSLDQRPKGSLKMKLGSEPEPVKIEFLRCEDRVGEKTKTEDSELKTSSTSKGESVDAWNVC